MNEMSNNAQAGWFALAAGAMIAGAMSFGTPASSQPQPHVGAPQAVVVAQQARLDEGVDWSKVAVAGNVVPLAVAAYER